MCSVLFIVQWSLFAHMHRHTDMFIQICSYIYTHTYTYTHFTSTYTHVNSRNTKKYNLLDDRLLDFLSKFTDTGVFSKKLPKKLPQLYKKQVDAFATKLRKLV